MSFDPKLIQDDEPQDSAGAGESRDPTWDELDLPDDLQALAEQLCGDAARLAALYPAESHDEKIMPSEAALAKTGLAPRWMSQAALATATVVVLAAGIQFWFARPVPQQAAQRNPSPANVTTELPPPTITPSIFQALTAPEQEAMLDLMENEQLGQASLSI